MPAREETDRQRLIAAMIPALDLYACTKTAWLATPDMAMRVAVASSLLGLGGWAAARRYFPGQASFVAVNVAMAAWIAASVTEHSAADPACKATMGLLAWLPVLMQPALWAQFIFQYLGSDPTLPRRAVRIGWLLVLTVQIGLAWTNGLHGLFYGPGSAMTEPIAGLPRLRYDYGPFFYTAVVTGYLPIAVAMLFTLRGHRYAQARHREHWMAFLGIMVIPIAANAAYLGFGVRLMGADPTSTAFAASVVGFGWMIARNRMFAVVPVARQRLFAELPDAVLVLDSEQRVLDANQAAQRLIGGKPPLGQPVAELPRIGAALQAQQADAQPSGLLVLDDGASSFVVQRRPLAARGAELGELVQLHDVTELQRAHLATARDLAEREDELDRARALQALLRQQALQDPLTGMPNRRALEERYTAIARQATGDTPITVVLLDLDHFKRVNDTHGHATGDAVLRDFAAAVAGSLKDEEGLFRLGGEEFAVLLPGIEPEQAADRLDALRQRMARWRLGGLNERITFSAGVAQRGASGDALDGLLEAADHAMYRAKADGRDRTALALTC